MSNCVIVIPIHSENPKESELFSLKQCYNILGKHEIIILAPKGLNIDKYKIDSININFMFIDSKWFNGVQMYNRLKMSKFFYKLFDKFEYLLTYELDAYVFSDELDYWCNKGYDYIGAPWFIGFDKPTNEFFAVGNSGFSLRKIKSMLNVINKFYYKAPQYYNAGRKAKVLAFLRMPFNCIYNLISNENITLQNAPYFHEDMLISQNIGKEFSDFKIAPLNESFRFSFEVHPSLLYKMNNNKLPFGCHAWEKYDKAFWENFIKFT